MPKNASNDAVLWGIYGFCAGMILVMVLDNGTRRREKEKIRRHLERALDEVDD